jgi:hypothetical protein
VVSMPNIDHYKWLPVEIPFDLTIGDLVVDPAAKASITSTELDWLYRNASDEELPRILKATALLFEANAGTIAECLHTAIIWERG